MEILSPVNSDTLETALASGADAVYFGLKKLNARRGAKNFSQGELADVVAKIHSHGAKAHLTVNIDLSTRETGLAARTLAFAQECGVDAVIVRDPAILALRPFFPRLEFHLSTQAGVSSSAGTRMARALFCDRVVLARELTHDEIAACCKIDGIEIETFGQGALCFCASGRCLLSSWVGGRSGNRGACASPCRVGWKLASGESKECHPLSMKDLCLVDELPELSRLGVASLKIEGRLKSSQWVSQAVTLYSKAKRAAAGAEELLSEAASLGAYTGRSLSKAYYAGNFASLTEGDLGRTRSVGGCSIPSGDEAPHLAVTISLDAQEGTCFHCDFGGATGECRIPMQRIANPKRAITLSDVLDDAISRLPRAAAAEFVCEDETLLNRLYPKRCQDMLFQELSDFLRQAMKEDDGNVRVTLPQVVIDAQRLGARCSANRQTLGSMPDTARFRLGQVKEILLNTPDMIQGFRRIILQLTGEEEITSVKTIMNSLRSVSKAEIILALPSVCYEGQLARLQEIAAYAAENDIMLEANSWDTLWIARSAGAGFSVGQGLAVLNPLAARMLVAQGAISCAISCEADQRQMEELTAVCEVPLSLVVYGRPALMTTRARLPEPFAPTDNGSQGPLFQDARKTLLTARKEGQMTALRPETPFDLRSQRNSAIAVAHLEMDFTGDNSPSEAMKPQKSPFLFNYDRQLR